MKKWMDSKLNALIERIEPGCIDRLETIVEQDKSAFGVDPYGFDPRFIRYAAPLACFLYRHYFRVQVHGLENIPLGRVLLISNHSGQIPLDAMMIATSVLLEHSQPRVVRGMVERWSADLPFISTWFSRLGQVVGEPKTCIDLLNREEAVLVFPEGVKGISKMFRERYQLQAFGHGFMRLAMESSAPIIPVAVVGAEEQAPAVYNLKSLAAQFGFPALPIILPQIVPIPLPVRYHIYFGQAIQAPQGDPGDIEYVRTHVQQVEHAIASLIRQGLEHREGWFT
jgi:1-acyl-sn-glycerol-3-phosphate acyltransferase